MSVTKVIILYSKDLVVSHVCSYIPYSKELVVSMFLYALRIQRIWLFLMFIDTVFWERLEGLKVGRLEVWIVGRLKDRKVQVRPARA